MFNYLHNYYIDTKQQRIFELGRQRISNENSPYTVNFDDSNSNNNDGSGSNLSKPKENSNIDINDANGGLMKLEEKKQIIDLTCSQVMINPDSETYIFGPDYPTKNVNYEKLLMRCPSNCYKVKNAIVYGVGAHPDISPICLSAIVDNAISIYGGIFNLSIFSGLESYDLPVDLPKTIHGILIKPYSQITKKSYVLTKVDNIDIVEKDIRIVNNKGELSYEGRLEMRYEGIWGTICSRDNDRNSAKVICRDIGYNDGEWKTPPNQAGKDYCSSFNDEDHCGAPTTRILFGKITCHRNHYTFSQCRKELPGHSICDHNFDAIIRCYNENYTTEQRIPDKTLRLESIKHSGNKVVGRLEIYKNASWKTICDTGFLQQSAMIACKQMRYRSGIILNSNKAGLFRLDSNSNVPFGAMNVRCTGRENNISQCSTQYHNVNCKHDKDVVIACAGTTGDPTGKSQYVSKKPTPLPKLGKLLFPLRYISCDIRGTDILFRGDPGSLYIIHCPGNCNKQSGNVWGDGIYSGDSFVCKSAIHASVIDQNGGIFGMVITYGLKKYAGNNGDEMVFSAKSELQHPKSFSVSQMNSAWKKSYEILQRQIRGSSFIETEESNSLSLASILNGFKSNMVSLSSLENSIDASNNLVLKSKKSSFLKLSKRKNEIQKIKINKSNENNDDFHLQNYNSHLTSFLELSSTATSASTATYNYNDSNNYRKLPIPKFQWLPPSYSFEFKTTNSVLLHDYQFETPLFDYTILMRFTLKDFARSDTYLFSFEGCGGFNMLIEKDGVLNIGDPCKEKDYWSTGFVVPIFDEVTLYLRYFNNNVSIFIRTDKMRNSFHKRSRVQLNIPQEPKEIGIARIGQDTTPLGNFTGVMNFLLIYKGLLDKSLIKPIIDSISLRSREPIFNYNKTIDNRRCVSTCIDNPTPPDPRSGKPPREADLNGFDEDSIKGFNSEDKKTLETIIFTCETTAVDDYFEGGKGKFFRGRCPTNCSSVTNQESVFGTAVFHPRSNRYLLIIY